MRVVAPEMSPAFLETRQKPFVLFRQAAESQWAAAQFCLAWCFEHGIGVEKNATEALRLDRVSADKVCFVSKQPHVHRHLLCCLVAISVRPTGYLLYLWHFLLLFF